MGEAVVSGYYPRRNGGARDMVPISAEEAENEPDVCWVEKGEWIPQTAPTGPADQAMRDKLIEVGADPVQFGKAFGRTGYNQTVACERQPVSRVLKIPAIKDRIEGMINSPSLAYNQQLAHCCRNPEEHGDIIACKSHADEPVPDIYIFICRDCGKSHPRFCCGVGDPRPVWEVR